MTRKDWRAEAESLLEYARAVRDGRACRAGAGSAPRANLPAGPPADPVCAAVRAALGYLLDEVRLVASGQEGTTAVLADEIAHTEAAVARL